MFNEETVRWKATYRSEALVASAQVAAERVRAEGVGRALGGDALINVCKSLPLKCITI